MTPGTSRRGLPACPRHPARQDHGQTVFPPALRTHERTGAAPSRQGAQHNAAACRGSRSSPRAEHRDGFLLILAADVWRLGGAGGGARAPHAAPGHHPFGRMGNAARTPGQNWQGRDGEASIRHRSVGSPGSPLRRAGAASPDAPLLVPAEPQETERPRLRVQAPLSSPAQGPASRGGGTTDPNHSAGEGISEQKSACFGGGVGGWGSPAGTSGVCAPSAEPALSPGAQATRGRHTGAPGCSARSGTAPALGSWREIRPKTSRRGRSCCCRGAGESPGPAPLPLHPVPGD